MMYELKLKASLLSTESIGAPLLPPHFRATKAADVASTYKVKITLDTTTILHTSCTWMHYELKTLNSNLEVLNKSQAPNNNAPNSLEFETFEFRYCPSTLLRMVSQSNRLGFRT